MWLVPSAAGLVATAFAVSLIRSHRVRPRLALVLWAIALGMYAVGSFAVGAGALRGFDATTFRIYWAFGAVLNVPFLAAGELDLLAASRRTTLILFGLLFVVTAITLARTWGAPIETAALAGGLPSGREVFGQASLAYRLPRLISTPAYAVLVAGTLWSAWRMRGAPDLRGRFVGTLWIAGGATVIAGFGSAFAALGALLPFSVAILLGVIAMFLGFRRAVRPSTA